MKYPYVARLDSPKKHTHGWFVRVHWKTKTLSKFFSDSKYKSRKDAQLAAVRCSKKFCRDLGRPYERRFIAFQLPRKSASGHRGVLADKNEEKKIVAYTAFCQTGKGKPVLFRYAISKFGKARALKLAVTKRKQLERKYYGTSLK